MPTKENEYRNDTTYIPSVSAPKLPPKGWYISCRE